ncbi:DUF2752 domain-containing protein [Flavobacterium sp. LS2P90]|uniref:DUF2752 domain-containing protein n=1 Tax=Flavobacterium xylosi TaxID=3230415 RepID=A0ABW6HSS1_9FLAO
MNLEKYMIPCLSKTLFGVECLGCGFQRGLLLLLQGNFAAAFQMYPAIYTTLLFLGILGLHFIGKKRNYKNLLIGMAIINGLFMIVGYLYKHY